MKNPIQTIALLAVLFFSARTDGFTAADNLFIPQSLDLVAHLPAIRKSFFTFLLSSNLSASAENDSECLVALKASLNHFLRPHAVLGLLHNSGFGINELGSYQGCKLEGGRYFALDIPLIKMGLCVPGPCGQKDLDLLREPLFRALKDIIGALPVKVDAVKFVDVSIANNLPITTGVYVTITLFLFLLFVGIAASFLDGRAKWLGPRTKKVVESFNLWRNAGQLLFAVNRVDPNLDVLNGVRILGMGWIVFGHMLAMVNLAPYVNLMDILNDYQTSRKFSLYVSADLSVDVFFCFTGFLGILVTTEQLRGSWSVKAKAIPLIYLHRYLRLLPVYAAAILFELYVLPYLYDGAHYYTVQTMENDCKERWYYHFLYINNFLKWNPCGAWTWYLANDFQMYLLVPPIVLLYQYRKLFAYLVVTVLAAISCVVQVCIKSYNDDLKRRGVVTELADWQYSKLNDMPYCRICPFLVGMVVAWIYIAYRVGQKARAQRDSRALSINPSVVAGEGKATQSLFDRVHSQISGNVFVRYPMYLFGFLIMLFFVVINYDFYKPNTTMGDAAQSAHGVLRRPCFAIGLMLCLYPAFLGKARVLRAVLGMQVFNAISRVVYGAYMFNMIATAFYHCSREDGLYFTLPKMWLGAVEVFVLTFAVGAMATLIFEYPVIGLSKEFLRPKRQSVVSVARKAEDQTGTTK